MKEMVEKARKFRNKIYSTLAITKNYIEFSKMIQEDLQKINQR